MTRPAPSLSRRLVAAALAWMVVALVSGGVVLSWAFRDSVEREFGLRLDALVRALVAATELDANGRPRLSRPLGDPRFDQVYSGWYWQVVGPGGATLRSRSLWDQVLAHQPGDEAVRFRPLTGPQGQSLLMAERDVLLADQAERVHVLVAADLAEVAAGVHRFTVLLVAALGLLGLGLAVAVLIQVRWALLPLGRLRGDLAAVAEGTAPRLSDGYPREVAPLAQAMNTVLDKDAELIERARTHVGNLAHGLKTPLAVLAAEVSAIEHDNAADRAVMRTQIEAMDRLIRHHLGRASAQAGAGAGAGRGDGAVVAAVAADIAAALAKVFADHPLAFDIQVAPELIYGGHAEDLAEILGNLMENACKWALRRVRVTARRENRALIVRVADDGPGLSPEQAQAAARRGARLDEQAEGWGLGLSIVCDLAQVQGGDVRFETSDLGGLEVVVRLP